MISQNNHDTLALKKECSLLEPIFIQALDAFSDDYKTLCKHHYPAIHNRGMSPVHLSAAFHRRLGSLIERENKTMDCSLFHHDAIHQNYIYSALIDEQKVWFIYPSFINAKTEAKTQLLLEIKQLKDNHNLQNGDYVAILCDHWFDRTRSSKTLYYWWTGMLPINEKRFNLQGIQNLEMNDAPDFSATIKDEFQLACINRSIYHPLEANKQHALLKYFLCFGLFQYHTQSV